MGIRYAVLSEIGLKRKDNEDAVFCADNGLDGIFMVADGMGGHSDGARASATLKNKMEAWWLQYIERKGRESIFHIMGEIQDVMEDANREIFETTKVGDVCGSTAVVLWIQENVWALFFCGDSRCYQVRKGILTGGVRQLTTDDVWENQQKNICGMSQMEIQKNVNFGRLIRAVGVEEEFTCTVQSDCIKDSTLFALCSDGVYKYCQERYFKKYLKKAIKAERMETCMKKIKNAVYQNGAPDNLSLIVVYVTT